MQQPPIILPGPTFEKIGKMVNLSDIASQFRARRITLYLPSYLSEGFKLTAIWVKVDEKGIIKFPLVVLYSKRNETHICAAEITIDICLSYGLGFRDHPNITSDRYVKIETEGQRVT